MAINVPMNPPGDLWVAPLSNGGYGTFWSGWRDGREPMWRFADRDLAWRVTCQWNDDYGPVRLVLGTDDEATEGTR